MRTANWALSQFCILCACTPPSYLILPAPIRLLLALDDASYDENRSTLGQITKPLNGASVKALTQQFTLMYQHARTIYLECDRLYLDRSPSIFEFILYQQEVRRYKESEIARPVFA
jgi:hypothetical protein